MHHALLIDEIVENIFSSCLQHENMSTLANAARSCKSWQDPALDRLWHQLHSIEPLLELTRISVEAGRKNESRCAGGYSYFETADSSSCVDEDSQFVAFRSYARRVRSITMSASTKVAANGHASRFLQTLYHSSRHGILPNLRSLRITLDPQKYNENAVLFLLCPSTRMERIDLNLGFTQMNPRTASQPIHRADDTYTSMQLCYLLSRLASTANASFRELNVRGLTTPGINSSLSSLRNLHTLSLRTGGSLQIDTLEAIAGFPNLINLDVHLGHITPEQSQAIAFPGNPFRALCVVRIRGHSTVIRRILDNVALDALTTVHVDVEDDAHMPVPWYALFGTIKAKTGQSLLELTIEHHIDVDELISSLIDLELEDSRSHGQYNTNNNNLHSKRRHHSHAITFAALQPLLDLHNLTRCVFDTTLPPDFCDSDIGHIVRAWGKIEHLHLGDIPVVLVDTIEGNVNEAIPLSDNDDNEPHSPIVTRTNSFAALDNISHPSSKTGWYPRMSLNSLAVLACSAPALTSLIIPLDLSAHTKLNHLGTNLVTNSPSSKLRSLTIGCVQRPSSKLSAECLLHLFPALVDVDGSPEFEADWRGVQEDVFDIARRATIEL